MYKTVADLPDNFTAITHGHRRAALRKRYNSPLPVFYVDDGSPFHAQVYAATVDAPGAPLKRLQ